MQIHFSKYQGTGNDFVVIDGRGADQSRLDHRTIRRLCDRRFGIGGDGLIVLAGAADADFSMRYFNADGHEGTMCGNGGRCITSFANRLGITGLECSFLGIDGRHTGTILPNGEVRVKLRDVDGIRWLEDGYLVDTGSPHYVKIVQGLEEMDVEKEGRDIRNQARFGKPGVNVNFMTSMPDSNRISLRTYERGVEAETLSCGTGATAAAICAYYHHKSDLTSFHVRTPGGNLHVSFQVRHHHQFSDIYLTGPVVHVYEGTIHLP